MRVPSKLIDDLPPRVQRRRSMLHAVHPLLCVRRLTPTRFAVIKGLHVLIVAGLGFNAPSRPSSLERSEHASFSRLSSTFINASYMSSCPPSRECDAMTPLVIHSERKFDVLDHRLDGLTRLLEDLKVIVSASSNDAGTRNDTSAPSTMVSTVASPSSRSVPSDPGTGQVAEGESSLSAHSAFVQDFLRGYVDGDSVHPPDSEIRRTMNALSGIVSASRRQPGAQETAQVPPRPKKPAEQETCKLPPIQKSVALIRMAKGTCNSAQRMSHHRGCFELTLHQLSVSLARGGFMSTSRCGPLGTFVSMSTSPRTIRRSTSSA